MDGWTNDTGAITKLNVTVFFKAGIQNTHQVCPFPIKRNQALKVLNISTVTSQMQVMKFTYNPTHLQ